MSMLVGMNVHVDWNEQKDPVVRADILAAV